MKRWLERPFARTFDLLSSEYGWTDDDLLDLTLMRMRQARDVVIERKGEERREQVKLAEAMTRTLASFIAGGPGEANLKNAARISFGAKDPDEDEGLPSMEQVLGVIGG